MKITDAHYKNGFAFIAVVMFIAFFIIWYINNEIEASFLLLFFACLSFRYRFTDEYKAKHSPHNLIKRSAGTIKITKPNLSRFKFISDQESIEVKRISIVNISDNWLSIIIDGNGNGYDFQLLGSKDEIYQQFNSLLNSDEKEDILKDPRAFLEELIFEQDRQTGLTRYLILSPPEDPKLVRAARRASVRLQRKIMERTDTFANHLSQFREAAKEQNPQKPPATQTPISRAKCSARLTRCSVRSVKLGASLERSVTEESCTACSWACTVLAMAKRKTRIP